MIQESAKTYMGNIEPDIAKKNWAAWMLDETVVQDKGGPNGCTRLWIWTTTTGCKYNDASLEKEVEGVVAKKSKASALDASSFASKVMSGHDRMAIAGFQLAGETEAGNGEKKVLGILDKIGGAARAEGVGNAFAFDGADGLDLRSAHAEKTSRRTSKGSGSHVQEEIAEDEGGNDVADCASTAPEWFDEQLATKAGREHKKAAAVVRRDLVEMRENLTAGLNEFKSKGGKDIGRERQYYRI